MRPKILLLRSFLEQARIFGLFRSSALRYNWISLPLQKRIISIGPKLSSRNRRRLVIRIPIRRKKSGFFAGPKKKSSLTFFSFSSLRSDPDVERTEVDFYGDQWRNITEWVSPHSLHRCAPLFLTHSFRDGVRATDRLLKSSTAGATVVI